MNKKNKKIIFIGSTIVIVAIIFGIYQFSSSKKVVDVSPKKIENVAASDEKLKKANTIESDSREKLEVEANQKEIETNNSGKNASERRGTEKTEPKAATKEELKAAEEEGEYRGDEFDVKLPDGRVVSEEDIANRKADLEAAGYNANSFSDSDMAKIIAKATEENMDVVGVVKADNWQ